MRKIVIYFIFVFLFYYGLVPESFSKESACVKCHTDEAVLKSLFKPPKISAEEGEG
jgi:hypothetical protein